MSITITLHAWYLLAWVGLGAVLWLPLEYLAYRTLAPPKPPFWPYFRSQSHHRPWIVLVIWVLWPLTAWEVFR